MDIISSEEWQTRCAADGEFKLAARHWSGGLTLNIGNTQMTLSLQDGVIKKGAKADDPIEFSGDEAVWAEIIQAVPARFHNDLMANASAGAGITLAGDPLTHAQYFSAAMRAVELLRPPPQRGELMPHDQPTVGEHATPVGRYVHLNLGGHIHRIYYEEAGRGIPILMQHTAGCHGSQWRHLFEVPAFTERFRLIAYDLPCHGKSVPPVSEDWWAQEYGLKGDFLRSVPVELSKALGLDRPVFMGCSVGGLLALDLAHKHPDEFRAVISVEGALNIKGSTESLGMLWHPKVSNEYKARLMDGLMSPTSPVPYRKETSFVYASGWPPVFIGDLHYYIDEFDLTTQAGEIDTNRVGVHILNGEYDYSGKSELGKAAHEAIAGSTWSEMKGVGHFPMSENPDAFKQYLLPSLDRLA